MSRERTVAERAGQARAYRQAGDERGLAGDFDLELYRRYREEVLVVAVGK